MPRWLKRRGSAGPLTESAQATDPPDLAGPTRKSSGERAGRQPPNSPARAEALVSLFSTLAGSHRENSLEPLWPCGLGSCGQA